MQSKEIFLEFYALASFWANIDGTNTKTKKVQNIDSFRFFILKL